MNLGGDKKEKKQDSSGIFSKMKDLLVGEKKEINDGEEFEQEKETLKKYKDVLKNEEDVKNYQHLKKEKKDIPNNVVKKDNAKNKDSAVDAKEKKQVKQTIKVKKEKFKQSWNAPKILKTNLAKGEQTIYIDWNKKIKKLSLMSALSCFFVLVVYFGLIMWGINTKSRGKILDSDIDYIKSQLSTSVDDVQEIDDFYGKLKNVNILLDKHIYWSNIFEFVEKNTFANVQIVSGLSGNPKSEYVFSVLTDNFTTLNQQVRHFRDQDEVISAQFEGGTIESLVNEEGQVTTVLSASINMTLKPEIFFK